MYFYSPTDSWIIGTVENVDEKNKKGAYSVRPSSLNKDPIVNDVSIGRGIRNHHH